VHSKGRRLPPLFVVALIAVPLGAAIAGRDAYIALIVPAIAAVLGLLALCRALDERGAAQAEDRRVLRWTVSAFAAHLLFGLVVTNTPSAVYYLGGDAGTYHTYARWIVEFGTRSIPGGLQTGKEGFYYTLASLYRVFGFHPVSGLVLNAALGAALVPLLTDATRRLFGRDAAHWVAPVVVLFPSMFLFTSQLLKEAPILFLLAVALNAAVRIAERLTLGGVGMLTLSVALLLTFRGPIALVAGIALIGGIALGRRQVLSGLVTGLIVVMVLGVVVIGIGVGHSGVQSALQSSSLQDANRVRTGLAYDAGSGIGGNVDTSTARQALSYLPVGLARFALGPFPWEFRKASQLPALIDVLVLWWLAPKAWRGFRSAARTHGRRLAVFLLPAIATATVLSLSVGNLGILVRERLQVLILVVPLLAYGISLRPGTGKEPAPEQVPGAPALVA
jgi:4-amino-4-deoxy-L-arabinose transferase-like glycosyltransferase